MLCGQSRWCTVLRVVSFEHRFSAAKSPFGEFAGRVPRWVGQSLSGGNPTFKTNHVALWAENPHSAQPVNSVRLRLLERLQIAAQSVNKEFLLSLFCEAEFIHRGRQVPYSAGRMNEVMVTRSLQITLENIALTCFRE